METWDAIVVGGGHNGLVAGAYLARAGARTMVLEARHKTGGAAATDAPWPEGRIRGEVPPGRRYSPSQLYALQRDAFLAAVTGHSTAHAAGTEVADTRLARTGPARDS